MGSPGSEELEGSVAGGSAAAGSTGSCADGSGGWSSKRVIEFLLSLLGGDVRGQRLAKAAATNGRSSS